MKFLIDYFSHCWSIMWGGEVMACLQLHFSKL